VSVKTKDKADTVTRCVPRQDGGFLIVTRKGASGYSPSEIHEGASITIRNGQVIR
jgi:hypothetical protein